MKYLAKQAVSDALECIGKRHKKSMSAFLDKVADDIQEAAKIGCLSIKLCIRESDTIEFVDGVRCHLAEAGYTLSDTEFNRIREEQAWFYSFYIHWGK